MSTGFERTRIAASVVGLLVASGCGGGFANTSAAWQKEDAYCSSHRAECQRECTDDERRLGTSDVAACEVLVVEKIEPMTGEEPDAPGWLGTIEHVCAHRRLDHPCAVAAKLRQGIEAKGRKSRAEQVQKDADVEAAKEVVAKAVADAAKADAAAAAARAEHDRKIAEEMQALSAAAAVCAKDAAACTLRCNKEPAYCTAWAARLRDSKPQRLTDAKAYLQKACDAGSQLACSFIPEAEQQIQQAAAETYDLWQAVERVADDIAEKRWMIQFARQHHTYADELSIRQAEAGVLRYAHDKLCPVKQAFVGKTGSAAEFSKRGTAHCADNPPIGSGQGNVYTDMSGRVVLTSQCQAAFATPCP